MLGRRVGKTASYTRWDARPLTAEQLGYAAEDVAHLLQLADEIQRRLPTAAGSGGRARSAAGSSPRPTSAIRTPPGSGCRASGSSIPRARAVARELAAWRERTASEQTARSARSSPTRRWSSSPSATRRRSQGLEQIRGLHPPTIKRRGQAILDAIARGREAPPIPRDEARAARSRATRR